MPKEIQEYVTMDLLYVFKEKLMTLVKASIYSVKNNGNKVDKLWIMTLHKSKTDIMPTLISKL